MSSELKQQYTLKISRANKTELIVILYEMLLLYVEEAKEAHEQDNRFAFREAIRKTRGCLNELMASLNFENDIAYSILQLYLYVNKELALADVKNSVEELNHIVLVIGNLHEAYQQISEQDTSEPVMSNTQTVYAGLTYGKGDLVENLSDQGVNRGFLV